MDTAKAGHAVRAGTPQAVQEGSEAFAQVGIVDRGREHHAGGTSDLVNQTGEVVLNDAMTRLSAQPPAVVFALAAAFDSKGWQEDRLDLAPVGGDAGADRLDGAGGLPLWIATA